MRDTSLPLVALPKENGIEKVCVNEDLLTPSRDCSKH